MTVKISLITPSFNQGEFLEETMLSVLSQNHSNTEYIVIDGGSTDESVNIIREKESQLTHWESEVDNGQSHAINKGLRLATGDVFNWLCSDDYLEEGALKSVAEHFENPKVRLVSAKFNQFDVNDANDIVTMEGIILDDTPEKTFARVGMTQPATFWRMDDIKKFGGINERLNYFMDLELVYKYLLYYGLDGIFKSNDVVANYRFHPNSKSTKEMDKSKILSYSKFNIEKNSIFYYLSKKYGMSKKIQNAIRALMDSVDEDYIMENLPEKPMLDIKKAVSYYLYDFLKRHFYNGDLNIAWVVARSLESNNLDNDDARGLKYIRRKLFFRKLINRE